MADYGINIGVNVQSAGLNRLQTQLEQLVATEKKLKAALKEESADRDKLNKKIDQTKQKQLQNKEAAFKSAKTFNENTAQIRKSSSALAEQVKQLEAYRRGTKVGSKEWNAFTTAITKTDFTRSFVQLRRLNKEAEATANAFAAMAAGGGRTGAQFAKTQSIENLLAFKPANTTNALTAYSNVLEQIIGQVDRGSQAYKDLALRIKDVNTQLSRAIVPTADQYGAPIGPDPRRGGFAASFIQGGRNIAGSPIARRLRNRRVSGAIGGGLIGGAFPALFGQSTQAAALGGIGGAAGGAIGGTFGFALGILGTALGEVVDKNIKFQQALKDLNVEFGKAGSSSKLFAGDIDVLAKSLKITREEALELAGAFAFLGDPKLATAAGRLFGGKQRFDLIAGIKDEQSFSQAILGIAEDFTDEKAKQLFLDTKDLEIGERRKAIAAALNKFKEKEVQLTNEEIRARGRTVSRRAFRGGLRQRPTELKTPVSEAEARSITDERAALLALLEVDKTTSVVDPTIGLQKRLEIVLAQVVAEQQLIDLQGKQTKAARMILRHEMAIAKAKAIGTAERKKSVDAEDIQLSQSIENAAIERAGLQFEREARELAEQSLKATEKLSQPLQDQLDKIKDKAAFEREYGDLINSGVIPAVAKQTVEINKQIKEIDRLTEKQLIEIDRHIEALQLIVDKVRGTELEAEMQERLNKALERRNEIESKSQQAKEGAKASIKTPQQRIENEITAVRGAINDLLDPANQVILAARAIGDAFSESFKGLITGSMTAQQALANFFQRTADHFADMAAQMIAKQIQMQILGIGLKFFGSAASAGSFSQAPSAAAGAAGANAFSQPAVPFTLGFAQGGYVSGPTRAVVGEGGQGEYVIPESKMRESMARYSRGARGASVIPESGEAGTVGGGGGTAVAAPIDVRYTVERINDVEYVTAAQFQAGMQQAAAQGAQRGEQQTLRRLQMSGSTRRRIGL